MLTLKVPIPPTTNHLYLNVKGKGRVKTKAYRVWQEQAGWLNSKAKWQPFTGLVAIEITVPTDRRRDLDNYLKALCDLLQYMGILKNDSQIEDLRIWRNGGTECVMQIKAME